MSRSRPTGRSVAILACLVLAAGTRLFPLWWSPLPATLDGIAYAANARDTLANGGIALAGFRADALVSTAWLSMGSAVTDLAPLQLAQPLYASIGAASVLLGAVFARRLGRSLGWDAGRIGRASVLAAFALAVDGVFVRRTGVPDDDALTLLVIPLVALAAHAYVRTERRAWLAVLAALLVALPFTHTFSTLVAAVVLLGLLAGHLVGRPLTRGRVVLVGGVVGFCAYFGGYYTWARSTALVVPYLDRIEGAPGLFIAWLVVLVVGVPWLRGTTSAVRRAAAGLPLAVVFVAIAVNARIAVFPGTSMTPPVVLAAVAPFAVPAVLAAAAAHRFGRDGAAEPPLLALFAGPVVLIGYSFTAGLTPEYFATALRAQTHLHLPALVAAAAVASRRSPDSLAAGNVPLGGLSRLARPALAAVLVVALVATLPAAYVDLDTGKVPSTTTRSEFAGGTFAADHVRGRWTSSHTQTLVAANYHADVNASVSPTAVWLRGGPSPACPVVSLRSWTTTGAHLFPGAPAATSPERYERWLRDRAVVYEANGYDPLVVSMPAERNASGC